MTPFTLIPFPGEKTDGLAIEGSLVRSPASLRFSMCVSGGQDALARLAGISLPPARRPERRDRLWTSTCFELFWGIAGEEGYWEFNLSPVGHWNVYALDGYRRGMRREERISGLVTGSEASFGHYRIWAELDLSGLSLGNAPLSAGLSAILDHGEGRLSYWALVHPGEQPDFHRREAFAIGLGG